MKNTLKYALVGALFAVAVPVASAADCYKVAKLTAKQITAKPKQVLSIVTKQITANEACACEIVKAAIVVTEADKKLVAQIVEQAIEAAPKRLSLITTCALAVAPDAHAEVMKVSAKYSKRGVAPAKRVAQFSPLDFIGLDTTGNFSPVQVFLLTSGGQTTPSNPYSQP